MEKRLRIVLLAALGVATIATAIMVAALVTRSRAGCELEEPFACADLSLTQIGLEFLIANTDEEAVEIRDIAVSRADGETCIFPRADGLGTLEPGAATIYLITAGHPDGACLMEGMERGGSYELLLTVEYERDGVESVASGRARTIFEG